MKAPTVSTYQQYVLFRQHARRALEASRALRKLPNWCFQTEIDYLRMVRDSHMRQARKHFSQVEFMEV